MWQNGLLIGEIKPQVAVVSLMRYISAALEGAAAIGVSRYLFPELNSESTPPALMSDLVTKGKLGAKTGEGFYSYAGDTLNAYLARRDRAFLGCLEVLNRESSS